MNIYDEFMNNIKIIHCEGLNPVRTNKIMFEWDCLNKTFLNGWKNHRIWVITEGHSEIKTIYGKITLEPNKAYFFQNASVLFAQPVGNFEHLYLDFNINNSSYATYLNFDYISKDVTLIISLLKKIHEHYKLSDPLNNFICQNAIKTILSCFISNDTNKHKNLSIFDPVLEYIRSHLCDMQPILTKELASSTGYSTEHFCRLFKETFGTTPKNYIINLKLSQAQNMLINTDASVCEISDACGFESQPYFTKIFTQKLSISPSKFRLLNKMR